MIRPRVALLASSVLALSVAALFACSSEEPSRTTFGDAPDSSSPEASLPPPADPDAGVPLRDAAPPPKPDYDASDEPVSCTATPCVKELASGKNHFCARLDDGTLRCWGDNTQGALGTGDGAGEEILPPTAVVSLSRITQISAAEDTTCARSEDGGVQCWGGNREGQLGLRANPAQVDWDRHPTPAPVAFTGPLSRVDVGLGTVCALGPSGLICWGPNDQKQLARPAAGAIAAGGPDLADMRGFSVARAGSGLSTGYAITVDKKLLAWGAASGREASINPDPIPFPIPTLEKVVAFSAGPSHTCAIAGGDVYCWGANRKGALGTGLPDPERFPMRAGLAAGKDGFPQQISVSENASCVRLTDGSIQCCGDDALGALGRGTPGSLTPLFGPASAFKERAVSVATSRLAACALVQGGKVVCWGGNENGELGQGTHDSDPHPTPVAVTFH